MKSGIEGRGNVLYKLFPVPKRNRSASINTGKLWPAVGVCGGQMFRIIQPKRYCPRLVYGCVKVVLLVIALGDDDH